MRAITIGCLAATFLVLSIGAGQSSAQSLHQLAYTNADIAGMLVRSGSTTTPVPTTKKSTFFGGIRNLFSSKKDTTLPPTPTSAASDAVITTPMPPVSNKGAPATTKTSTPTTIPTTLTTPSTTTSTTSTPSTTSTTTTTTTRQPSTIAAAVQPQPNNNRPKDPLHEFESFATIKLSSTTTTKKPKTVEDFPALPAPRRPNNNNGPAAGAVSPTAQPPVSGPSSPNPWTKKTEPLTPPPSSPSLPTVTPTGRPSFAAAAAAGAAATAAGGAAAIGTAANPSAPNDNVATPNSRPATSGGDDATDAEIEALTEVLYTKESSMLPLLSINYQGRTWSAATDDEAAANLITINDVAAVNANPTVAKMKLLYNNYEQDQAVNEHVTAMERNEENDFVDALLSGAQMRQTMQFLQQKGRVTLDPKTHRDLLKTIWFSLYSRGRGKIGSSAFEHVFLTELRNGTVSGFHNWIYYYDEELAGRANYMGWLKKVNLGTKATIVKYRFAYNGVIKPVNAMFVGTSPDLEMSLYTLCFAMRADRECNVSLGGQKLMIRTHTFRYRGKNLIGSAFPEI